MSKERHSNFVDLKNVTVDDSFWSPIMERVRTKVIPYQWEALNDRIDGAEPSYCMSNFKIAAQLTHPGLDYGIDNSLGHKGCVFQDSDYAKWVEAAAYSLICHPDPELEKSIDGSIDIVCSAQQEDGYLNTYYIINGLDRRFTNMRDNHELYCFGHLMEAAVAYYDATGKRKLMDALIRYADCVDQLIGPEEGKIHGYPGHEIAEMALVRLYAVTKNERHLALAKYFINQRGQVPLFFDEEIQKNGENAAWKESYFQLQYYQAGKPARQQHSAEGHAVRAVYFYSGMADIARLTGDGELLKACENLFANISKKQMYITGGIGQSDYGESFTYDYDLPNDTVYAETCASIGLIFFARRMASIFPRGEYGDVMERVLYNGILSGMSLDGNSFFYVNPLEVLPEASLKNRLMRHVRISRPKWFGCACCPPNLARIIASLGNYIHSANGEEIYTHLFIGSNVSFNLNGRNVRLKMESSFPWEGKVKISFALEGDAAFGYRFRIPSWCRNWNVSLNNSPAEYTTEDGFAVIRREWKNGDSIEINFEMPVTLAEANPLVRQNAGKLALTRGPLVYCLEEADNGNGLCKIRIGGADPTKAKFNFEDGLLGGVVAVSLAAKKEKNWDTGELYRPAENSPQEDKLLRFIPYYAWANRGAGEMVVWINK